METESELDSALWPNAQQGRLSTFQSLLGHGKRPRTRRVEEREEITVVVLATRRWALSLENIRLTRRNWEQRICGEWSRAAHPRIFFVTSLSAFQGESTLQASHWKKATHVYVGVV